MSASYFRTLDQYNRWANRLVLDAAARVAEADYFATVPGLSFGSLHATLVHAILAEIVWIARFNHALPPESIKDARMADQLARSEIPAFQDVLRRYEEEGAKQERFFAALTDADCSSVLSYVTQYGEPWSQRLDELMAHFFNHSTQFRSEASVRLSQLGVSPGDTDLIIFMRQR